MKSKPPTASANLPCLTLFAALCLGLACDGEQARRAPGQQAGGGSTEQATKADSMLQRAMADSTQWQA